MKPWLTRLFKAALRRLLPRTVSGGLMALALALLCLDHRWTELTWGALALAAGAVLTQGRPGRETDPLSVRVRHVPDPGDPAVWNGRTYR